MKKNKFILAFSIFPFILCDKPTGPAENNNLWIQLREKSNDITYSAIFFTDRNTGRKCGDIGTIKISTDGGKIGCRISILKTSAYYQETFFC